MRLSFFSAQRTVSIVILAFLLTTSFLWVWHIVGMEEDGAMTSCLLAGGRVMFCVLGTVAQIGLWHEMFAAVLPLAPAVLFAAATFLKHRRGTASALDLERRLPALPAPFIRRFRDWLPREPLREAFSRGILHPKIYAPAQS